MKWIAACILTFSLAPTGWAQRVELGGLGGYGIQAGLTAKTADAEAKTGFHSGGAWGIVGTDNMYPRISGELRYLYRWGDLRVESGGEKASFSGRSHIVHYDFLFHTQPREARVRPFVAVGAGIKVFQGTGVERAYQPLSQFVLLTKKTQTVGLFSVGGGVKWAYRDHLTIRVEIHDYISPAPDEVLVPAPGASVSGWLHDVLPLVGLSYRF